MNTISRTTNSQRTGSNIALSIPQLRRRFAVAFIFLIVATGGLQAPAVAATWIHQAQAELMCTALADDQEVLTYAASTIPPAVNSNEFAKYFLDKPRDLRHERLRYFITLASIAWWADLINDQSLRIDVYVTITGLSERYAAETGDDLFRHIARCAAVSLIGATIEQDRPELADRVALRLLQAYGTEPPKNAVEDWPLILALQELVLERRSRVGIAQLSNRAMAYAEALSRTGPPERVSRLLAAAGRGALALDEYEKAQQLALGSWAVTGKPPTETAQWRALPTLYDAWVTLKGPAQAADVSVLLRSRAPPSGTKDQRVAFETLLRLSVALDSKQQVDDALKLEQAASKLLTNFGGLERYSMPFYREALKQLARRRDPDLGKLARIRPDFAATTLSAYTRSYETLLKRAQTNYIAAAREQAWFHSRVDNSLYALSELYGAMPASQATIADISFRLAQLRSFGGLTLANVSAEIARADIEPAWRFNVERFFTLSTQTPMWLRGSFGQVNVTLPKLALPDGKSQWRIVSLLDVFHNEMFREFERYVALLRTKAPSAAELATPKPLPLHEFQRRLRAHEAIIATVVTPLDLYAWVITAQNVRFTRHRITEGDVRAKVQRLRAGLVPTSQGGQTSVPDFDAAAAHELYRLLFTSAGAALEGVTEILWYGHGPLGSVPPSVLVTSAPKRDLLRTPSDFADTSFLVDRFAFASLADLSLFALHRDRPPPPERTARFLGVGAPMLDRNELTRAPRPRSYDLAGALDGKALAALPKLPESVDEMKGLAAVFGDANSELWLGPDAEERRFDGKRLQGFQTIALATHGFLPDEVANVREASLMLAIESATTGRFDGILTSSEIAQLTLDADLVILSACNTASADNRPRAEAFTGLSQAFFTAGARSLLVSHWPVMSGAAVQLSVETVRRKHAEKLSLSKSLQLAIQAVRKEGASSAIEAHPAYWGPFVVVGDGR